MWGIVRGRALGVAVPAGRVRGRKGMPAAGARPKARGTTEAVRGSTGALCRNRLWFGLATVMTDVQGLPRQPDSAPPPQLLDRQGWSTLVAGSLLLLISFTTNYGNDNLSRFRSLPASEQVGICLHLAALAALAGDGQLATRLRHRAGNREAEDRIARKREALEASAREQRQNRALRAGALFLLEPSPLHRRFLAYIANELAGPPQGEQAS